MKNVTITQFSFAEVDAPKETFGYLRIPLGHRKIRAEGENLEVSDGYHTFDELYDHRIALFIALCKKIEDIDQRQSGPNRVWRAKKHHDGSEYEGWFIMGIHKEKGRQISYHLPLSKWDDANFADTYDITPEWDGHTPEDVLTRLSNL